jgi:hypothetical protein
LCLSGFFLILDFGLVAVGELFELFAGLY